MTQNLDTLERSMDATNLDMIKALQAHNRAAQNLNIAVSAERAAQDDYTRALNRYLNDRVRYLTAKSELEVAA